MRLSVIIFCCCPRPPSGCRLAMYVKMYSVGVASSVEYEPACTWPVAKPCFDPLRHLPGCLAACRHATVCLVGRYWDTRRRLWNPTTMRATSMASITARLRARAWAGSSPMATRR